MQVCERFGSEFHYCENGRLVWETTMTGVERIENYFNGIDKIVNKVDCGREIISIMTISAFVHYIKESC